MWKIAIGFAVFAALALFFIMKGGDKIDMGGEKHGSETTHAVESKASAPAPAASPAPAAQPAASAASASK